MNKSTENILKVILAFIFILFWFPILLVDNSRYDWVNNFSEIARIIAGIVGAFTIFNWIVNKYIEK